MKAKDIFGLAVRLLGLFFLYLGLNAIVPAAKQMYDLGTIPDAGRDDVIEAIITGPLPAVVYLVFAWWLLRSRMLLRWAYPDSLPDTLKISDNFSAPARPITALPEPLPSPQPQGMDRADEKLAALVEKPKNRA
jgi:hypothetical protein